MTSPTHRQPSTRRRLRLLPLLAVTAITIAACNGSDVPAGSGTVTVDLTGSTTAPPTTPATTNHAAPPTTVAVTTSTSTTTSTTTPTAGLPTIADLEKTLADEVGDLTTGRTYSIGLIDGDITGIVSEWDETDISMWTWDGMWQENRRLPLGDSRAALLGDGQTSLAIIDVTGDTANDIVVWYQGPRRPVGTILTAHNGSWVNIGERSQLQIAASSLISVIANDCDPSCAEGTDRVTYFGWTGKEFEPCRDIPWDASPNPCRLTPG